jgi:[ribosomal protein S18]-alanine N-acetyltransferase
MIDEKFYILDKSKIIEINNNNSFQNKYKISCDSEHKTIFVIETNNKIIGFIEALLIENINECEIFHIEISKNFRNKNFGFKLMLNFLQFLINKNVNHIFLEVRESNNIAKKLYNKLNFKFIGNRKNYYSNPKENAILMKLNLIDFDLKKFENLF